MKDEDGSDDDEVDVPDPHMNAEERKREMEGEMNQAERRDLRGGFEEYVEVEPGPSGTGVKRELDLDRTTDGHPPPKKKTVEKPGFGAEMIKQERLRSLGMAQRTLSTSDNRLGQQPGLRKATESTVENEVKPEVMKDWACQVCTFVNVADQGRCGELSHWRCFELWDR